MPVPSPGSCRTLAGLHEEQVVNRRPPISANAYLGLTSLSVTRLLAVPDDVRGFRREDPAGWCGTRRYRDRTDGPAPATRHTGQTYVANVCLSLPAGAPHRAADHAVLRTVRALTSPPGLDLGHRRREVRCMPDVDAL